jgi:hypothetical protein
MISFFRLVRREHGRRWRPGVVVALTGLALTIGVPPAGAIVTPGDGDGSIITPGDGGGSGGSTGCVNTSSGTLSASTAIPLYTQPVTVSWDAALAPDCWSTRLYYPDGSTQVVPASGSITVTPPIGTQTWTLRVSSAGGTVQLATLSVTVVALPRLPGAALARNADGRLDLVTAYNSDQISRMAQTVPNGTYAGSSNAGAMTSVATELDADRRIETFATNGSGQIFHNVQTYAGSAGWSAWSQMDGGLISIAAARNADGRLEIFGTNASGTVWHRAQVGPGASGSGSAGWTGWTAYDGALRQVAAETNADGRVELFGINADGGIYHRWQTAPNSSTWSPWANIPGTLASIAVARNADGRLELIGTDPSGNVLDARQVSAGASTLTSFTVQPNGHGGPIAAEAGEDGRVEIVGKDARGQFAHRAQSSPGSTTWTDWVPLDQRTAPSPLLVACVDDPTCHIADVNDDRMADLITIARAAPNVGNVRVSLGNSQSPGDFAAPQTWASGLCQVNDVCAFADVTGDGKADAVAFRTSGTSTGTVQVAPSTGNDFAVTNTWASGICSDLDTCVLADLNADGKADVVTFDRSSVTAINDGRSRVALSDGFSSFGPTRVWSTAFCLTDQACYAADVNNDGRADAVALVTTGANKGQAWVALNTGAAFAPAQLWTSDSKCIDDAICDVGDFDHDGRADVLAKSPSDTADSLVWVSVSTGAAFGPSTKRDPSTAQPRIGQDLSCTDLLVRAVNAYTLFEYYGRLAYITGLRWYTWLANHYEKVSDEYMAEYHRRMC